jgi:hypothetical protein
MTELAANPAAPPHAGRIERLSLPVRIGLLAVSAMIFLLSVGVIMGVMLAALKHGALKTSDAFMLTGASLGAGLFGWACWTLGAHWRRPGRSAYERRYSKMMVLLFTSGLPIGLLIGMAGDGQPGDALFSNGPLDSRLAAVAAIGLVVTLAATLVIYHRSIDDHEQQAYLWANSLAFYFLALALPAAWLLARGGLIPPIGIGSAMHILLAAFVINFTVWAWLKFR